MKKKITDDTKSKINFIETKTKKIHILQGIKKLFKPSKYDS